MFELEQTGTPVLQQCRDIRPGCVSKLIALGLSESGVVQQLQADLSHHGIAFKLTAHP